MSAKVCIEITEGHTYSCRKKSGQSHTSVGLTAGKYGCVLPCNNERDVRRAVASCRAWVQQKGDTPILVDRRKKAALHRLK